MGLLDGTLSPSGESILLSMSEEILSPLGEVLSLSCETWFQILRKNLQVKSLESSFCRVFQARLYVGPCPR